MNTEKIAKGWALIAEGAMELSLAYESIESSAPVRADEPDTRSGFAGAGEPPPSPVPVQEQHIEQHLGVCPDHGTAWKAVPGGVSRTTGKPYSAFYACANRDCKKRPVKAWTDAHPLAAAA